MAVFSKDEMVVEFRGVRYSAVEGIPGKCAGCAFPLHFGCILAEEVYRDAGCMLTSGARCSPERREDGKHIIWQFLK